MRGHITIKKCKGCTRINCTEERIHNSNCIQSSRTGKVFERYTIRPTKLPTKIFELEIYPTKEIQKSTPSLILLNENSCLNSTHLDFVSLKYKEMFLNMKKHRSMRIGMDFNDKIKVCLFKNTKCKGFANKERIYDLNRLIKQKNHWISFYKYRNTTNQ